MQEFYAKYKDAEDRNIRDLFKPPRNAELVRDERRAVDETSICSVEEATKEEALLQNGHVSESLKIERVEEGLNCSPEPTTQAQEADRSSSSGNITLDDFDRLLGLTGIAPDASGQQGLVQDGYTWSKSTLLSQEDKELAASRFDDLSIKELRRIFGKAQ